MLEFFLLWIGLSIAVAAAANTRGRNAPGWFFLALLISPLIAGLLIIALPNVAEGKGSRSRPFRPDGVRNGIPYRISPDGLHEAMMPGGLVSFANFEQFAAAADGASIDVLPVPAEIIQKYPHVHGDYRYKVNKDGSVDAMSRAGQVHFRDWAAFWHTAN
jgi:hypothetical protein